MRKESASMDNDIEAAMSVALAYAIGFLFSYLACGPTGSCKRIK